MLKRIGIAVLLAGLSAEAGLAKAVTKHVEVDGARYRVTVKDGVATIARKSLVVTYNVEERDRQRAAAQMVTGCRLVDEMPNGGGITIGKLDCVKPAASPAKP